MQDRSFQEKNILMILTSFFLFRGCLFPFVLQVSGVKVRESVVKKKFPSHASEWNVFLQVCVQRKSLQSTLVESDLKCGKCNRGICFQKEVFQTKMLKVIRTEFVS